MLRFLKFIFLGLAAYSIYEIARGMLGYGDDEANAFGLNEAMNQESGRMQTLTGAGGGRNEQTLDSDGASIPHRVGRGVVVH